jgi:hypothetical protein
LRVHEVADKLRSLLELVEIALGEVLNDSRPDVAGYPVHKGDERTKLTKNQSESVLMDFIHLGHSLRMKSS